MRHERQVELLERLAAAGERYSGLFGPTSRVQPAAAYTDLQRFDAERAHLFRRGPILVGLSVECPQPGDHVTADMGGVPIVVVRQPDGSLRGLVNACRHRGAPLVAGNGNGLRRFVCGYHAWTYELDGTLVSRPLTDGAFDDVTLQCNLRPVHVAEGHGLVFAASEPFDAAEHLGGAADDLAAYELGRCAHVESRTTEWRMNWKLLLDTFCESYHIRTLHRSSLAPTFDSTCTLFESFGTHFLNVGFRKTVSDEFPKPAGDRALLPYATAQYFLLPNAMLCYQVDHVELWRLEPIDVRTTRVTTSVFAMEGPVDERTDRYLRKNLGLLLDVTGGEDFPLMERIQRNLDSGALPEVVYGRNEAALVHFHATVDRLLAARATPS